MAWFCLYRITHKGQQNEFLLLLLLFTFFFESWLTLGEMTTYFQVEPNLFFGKSIFWYKQILMSVLYGLLPTVNQSFLGYKWNSFLRRPIGCCEIIKNGAQISPPTQPIGRLKKHLRKKPFHLYPRKFWFTIGSYVGDFQENFQKKNSSFFICFLTHRRHFGPKGYF